MRSTRRLSLIVAAFLVMVVPGVGHAGPDAVGHGITSANVEHIRFVPIEIGTATGARVVGNYLYLTGWRQISIYSLANPEDPQLVSTTPLGFKFESEDVATNGKILLFSESLPQNSLHVWDVNDKAHPVEISSLMGAGNHTSTCVADCQFAYGSSCALTDLRNPAAPVNAGSWCAKSGTSGGHDVREVGPGLLHVANGGQANVIDVSDPLNPVKLSSASSGNAKPAHSSTWPNQATDRFLLGGSETNATGRCNGTSNGATSTWDMSNWRSGAYTFIDSWRAASGILFDGSPPANVLGCSAHWLEASPSFRDGGIFAQGYYEHGTRFFYVNGAGKLRQVGFFVPFGGSTSAAYWVTDRIVYAIDYTRGIDILKWTGALPNEPDASTGVPELSASSGGNVSGVATFLGESTTNLLAEDPANDGPGAANGSATGVDITEANIFQPDATYPELVFTWKVSNLPNPVTGVQPENVRYVWRFTAGGRTWLVQAKSSTFLQTTTPDDPTGNVTKATRAFQLRGNCAVVVILNSCGHIAWLDGSFDAVNKTISIRLPLNAPFAPEIKPGATIAPVTPDGNTDIYASIQVFTEQPATQDLVTYGTNYVVPQRTVALGVAPAGTDPSQVTYGAPIVVSADGAFAKNLGPIAAGNEVFAKACFGNTCAFRSVAV